MNRDEIGDVVEWLADANRGASLPARLANTTDAFQELLEIAHRTEYERQWLVSALISIVVAVVFLLGAFTLLNRAHAEESHVLVYPGAVSYHWKRMDDGRRFNDANLGIVAGYAWDRTHAVLGGVMRNSEWRTSAVAAYRYTPIHISGVRLGVAVGAATGYMRAPVVPCAGFALAYDIGYVSLSVLWAPQINAFDRKGNLSFFLGART